MPRVGWNQRSRASKPITLQAIQRDDRLIVGGELRAAQRGPQVGLQFEPLQSGLVHEASKHGIRTGAIALGAIHRQVGVAQHLIRVLVMRRAERDPDADAGVDVLAANAEFAQQHLVNAIGHACGVFETGHFVQQDGELVSPQPGDRIPRTQEHADALSEFDQQLIARGVTQTVVHHLESIEVEKQHGKLARRLAAVLFQGEIEPVQEQGPVGQSGQRVVQHLMTQAALPRPSVH